MQPGARMKKYTHIQFDFLVSMFFHPLLHFSAHSNSTITLFTRTRNSTLYSLLLDSLIVMLKKKISSKIQIFWYRFNFFLQKKTNWLTVE